MNKNPKIHQKPVKNPEKFPFFTLILSILAIFLLIFATVNFQSLKDIYLSLTFTPSEPLKSIESSLSLTSLGDRIFRASMPSLESDHNSFEKSCYSEEDSPEASVLGCFTDEKIFVYEISSEELAGVVESTSAHELLHAIYSRLSSSEHTSLTPVLEEVYSSAPDEFRNSIELYPDSQRLEEIYVRSGTQLRDLPDSLEAHFKNYFENRDKIVAFYDSYIAPFTAIKNTLSSLESELSSLKSEIDAESASYSSRSDAFLASANAFNSCASTPNCYTESAFNSERTRLLAEQSSLESLYNSLNAKIDSYNKKVELYNSNIFHGKSLESLLNPNRKEPQ